MEHRVGHLRDLESADRLLVDIDGHQIGVFRVDGQLYAVLNRCPHQGGPVCTGGLFDEVQAEVAPDRSIHEYIASRGHTLACPYHGWEYDLRDGACLWNRKLHLHTYAVRADDEGNVLVAL